MKIDKVSIVIPVYNEKNTVAEVIARVKAVDLGEIEKEVIVVDDASTDGTRETLKAIGGIKTIFHPANLGKGGAIRSGFSAATGDVLILQDADLEYDPNDFKELIKPILRGKGEIILGVRINPDPDERRLHVFYWLTWLGNKTITWATNWLYWNDAGEYEACYKAFSKRLVRSVEVRSNGFEYDNEFICKLLKRGHRTVDMPIHYYPRGYKEGKKIKPTDGFKILWTIVKYRLVD